MQRAWASAMALGIAGISLTSRTSAQEAAAPPPVTPAAATQPIAPQTVAPATTASAPPVAAPAPVPLAVEPTLVQPLTAPPAPETRPAFWTNQTGVTFHYVKLARAGSDFVPGAWERLCLASCNNTLTSGSYRLALSHGANPPVMAEGVFNVTPSSRFEGVYSDRSSTRLAGALVLGLGGVSALTLLTTGAVQAGQGDETLGTPFIVSGLVGLALSMVIGIPLAATSDESRIDAIAR